MNSGTGTAVRTRDLSGMHIQSRSGTFENFDEVVVQSLFSLILGADVETRSHRENPDELLPSLRCYDIFL